MPEIVVIEPPIYRTITHVMHIRMDKQFARTYDKYAEVCRAVYNRAVHEVELGGPERLTYLPYGPKDKEGKGPHLNRSSYELAEKAAGALGVDVAVIRNMVRSQLGGRTWYYAFPPNSQATRNRIMLLLTKWRAEHGWIRDCPVQYERGAIREAVNAAERSISDNSDMVPKRGRGKHAPLFCPSNQSVNRRGPRELRVPGFTLHTKKVIPKHWDIRSCRIVETTPYRNRSTSRGGRTFEVHIQVRECVKRQPTNVAARAADMGGMHVAATADTTRHTTIQTMPHTDTWREIRALQSERDRKKKGSHAWLAIDKSMRIKRTKAKCVSRNARLQGAAYVARDVRAVVLEILDFKAMTARGGNRKRRLNDMLRLAGVGGFRGDIIRNAAKHGIRVILVDAKNSSNECAVCGHVSKESRISRDCFICVNCGDESHADINAACVILKRGMTCLADRAEGQAVLRRRAIPCNQPTQWSAWPRRRGPGPPQMRWGRQKVTQVEVLPRL